MSFFMPLPGQYFYFATNAYDNKNGLMICDGRALSRTQYATLFAVIGTTFGAGDGSTTFNIPDYRDKVPGCAGTTHSLGSSVGTETVAISTSNLPATDFPVSITQTPHAHGATSDPHAHSLNQYALGGTFSYPATSVVEVVASPGGQSTYGTSAVTVAVHVAGANANITAVAHSGGSNTPINIMQPTLFGEYRYIFTG